ncbi:hypothetical protein CGCF413_v010387 [Colletotrichum fructicola]|nr:hypothetical protein CGCF413_v010387 [Colletotrichum fructicola]
MPDRDNLIHKALMCATSLNAREKKIVIEAWLLAKRSHDTLSSAWAASKEKVQLAENDDEAKEYWAKFEGVRAQYALIDKIAQQKEQLARKWRPAEVINIDADVGDSSRGDGARDKATEEASTEAVEVRNIDQQKPVQTSDDISAGFQASTADLLQLGLDEILGSPVSVPVTKERDANVSVIGQPSWPSGQNRREQAQKTGEKNGDAVVGLTALQ